MNIKKCMSLLLFIWSMSLAQNIDPFIGVFSNGQLKLTLNKQNNNYVGYFEFDEQSLKVTAIAMGDSYIIGQFTFQNSQNSFQAYLEGDQLTVSDGSEVYVLSREKSVKYDRNPSNESLEDSHRSANETNKPTDHHTKNQTFTLAEDEIGDSYLGWKFRSPAGWQSQKTDQGYVFSKPASKGFIVVMIHQYSSLSQMRAEAQQGISEQGTALQISGDIRNFGDSGLSAAYEGMMNWQKVRVHAIGLISPYGGGPIILAGATTNEYNDKYKNLAESMAKSVTFFKPEIPPVSEEWKQRLSGARLTYLWSYYSGGTGGAYAGGSQKTIIDLCEKGYFRYSDSDQMAVDGGAGSGYQSSGYSGGTDRGQGTWEVTARGQQPILRLKFHDGRVFEYQLSMQDGKTFLDDKRFFRTYSNDAVAEHRPQCW